MFFFTFLIFVSNLYMTARVGLPSGYFIVVPFVTKSTPTKELKLRRLVEYLGLIMKHFVVYFI